MFEAVGGIGRNGLVFLGYVTFKFQFEIVADVNSQLVITNHAP